MYAMGKTIERRTFGVSEGQDGHLRLGRENFPEKTTFEHKHPKNGSRNKGRMKESRKKE